MSDIITINDIPEYNVPPAEHAERNNNHIHSCMDFVTSVQKADNSIFAGLNCGAELPDMVPFASNPKWKDLPFGAANTCGNASCAALQTVVILNYLNSIASDNQCLADLNPSVLDTIHVLTQNGYRSWRLSEKPGTMTEPKATVEGIKNRFPDDDEIQGCKSLDEIFKKFGTPVGIGGSVYWLDNVIKLFSFNENVEIANHTRIHSIEDAVDNLSRGIVVPIRVQNSVYLGEKNRSGGHYVTWFRIEDGKAVIVDTSMEKHCGIYHIPVEQLLDAIVSNPSMSVVWNVEPVVSALTS